ncbi:hypothetical protein NEMBOFW57_002121 [Staphylotrichum longicolle]|uniref:Uncharacterized protein n=1 Tax=Staphylotrichum longicolle TaxID=669026 RepID=A0AAD4F3G3_9PEZI|nr:hypothetical protein NEMBOFW57_002121 [Staphylotrichum longicolle]
MAPSAPTRPRLTLKGVERKRPGPAPKPLSERLKSKPLKQVKRIERSYTRERKIEVLNYLLNHRVPDGRRTTAPRRRIGQPPAQELVSPPPTVREENGEYVWYRAPTYAEASDFWKIPTPTIQGWWDRRKKLLAGTGIEVPEVAERPSPARRAPTGASAAPNRSAQPTTVPREGAQGAAQEESVIHPLLARVRHLLRRMLYHPGTPNRIILRPKASRRCHMARSPVHNKTLAIPRYLVPIHNNNLAARHHMRRDLR